MTQNGSNTQPPRSGRTACPERSRRKGAHRPRRGLFLINMLMTIGLLAAFVIVAERVFRLSLLTAQKSAAAQESALRMEQSLDLLHSDVWTAKKIDLADNGVTLKLTDPADHPITWHTDPQTHDLLRTTPTDQRRWPATPLTFQRKDNLLSASQNGHELAILRHPSAGGAQ